MRFWLKIVLLVLLVPSTAIAEIQNRGQLFKLLCIGEKSVGFDWSGKEWTVARFKPEKYVVEKMPIDNKMTPFCTLTAPDDKGMVTEDYALQKGCYSIHEFGYKSYPMLSKLCLEEWRKIREKWTLELVFCNDEEYINLKPEGMFILSQWSAPHDLDEKADRKDLKSITVGRCGIM